MFDGEMSPHSLCHLSLPQENPQEATMRIHGNTPLVLPIAMSILDGLGRYRRGYAGVLQGDTPLRRGPALSK